MYLYNYTPQKIYNYKHKTQIKGDADVDINNNYNNKNHYIFGRHLTNRGSNEDLFEFLQKIYRHIHILHLTQYHHL